MVDEMVSLHKNEAWDLVELPAGRNPIVSKWVFKKKTNAEGKVEKYKAQLVEKFYSQVPGIDFGDIVSPVAKVASIRLLLSVATAFDFKVEQMDVKTTFLHMDLEKEIYMRQPEGFAMKGKKELVYKLKKSLYGLKQSPRMWYQKFDTFIQGLGFTRSEADHCVYFKFIGDRVIYLFLFMSKPRKEHWTTVKWVFRYLRRTIDYGLCYQGRPGLDRVLDIRGFVDAEWVGDLDQRRSTSGGVFNLFGCAVSWMSKK
eukprot:PITA_35768